MTPKIVWPQNHIKGNPFGGIDGFRRLTITFHSASFDNLSLDDKKALDMLHGFAKLDQIDAMSFGGEISPKIFIGTEESKYGNFDVRVIDESENMILYGGVPKFWVERDYVIHFMGTYNSQEEEKYLLARQNLLEVETHQELRRDIFITSSRFLLDNRHRLFNDPNVQTPSEALKVVALYLRTYNEHEWVLEVKGNVTYHTSQENFYRFLALGLLPSRWRYTSGLGLHPHREELTQLGRSILDRCSRALKARDEIARLFYMPETRSTKDQRIYHFDYLTLLLTSALDVEALIISRLYDLKTPNNKKRLSDSDCGFSVKRENFRKAIQNEPLLKAVLDLLEAKKDYIEILFGLRNKIHSISWEENFTLPENYQNELFDKVYNYDGVSHWGINKQNINLSENGKPLVPAYRISIDIYALVRHLIDEGFSLIDSIMKETNIEALLDAASIGKIRDKPPDPDMASTIERYLLLS